MQRTEARIAIAQRLKAAATQAGLSGSEMARRLGVAPSVVHRWWYGDRKPSSDHLMAYAQLVGKPAEYFYGREGEAEELPREMADFLLHWAGRLMAGEEPGAAFDRVTGKPQELTPQERKQLAAAAPRMREELMQAAGRDWELLTEAERRQILDQIAHLAEGRRATPVESPP